MAATCVRFWGPFSPIAFGESTDEGGGSFYLPAWSLVISRSASASCLATLTALALTHGWPIASPSILWVVAGCAITFALLAVASLHAALQCKCWPIAARIVAPLHFTATSCALYAAVPPIQDITLTSGAQLVCTVVPTALVIADFAMGAQLRFRLAYAPIPILGAVLRLLIAVQYGEGAARPRWLALQIPMVIVAVIAALVLSRLSALCVAPPLEKKSPPEKLDRHFLSCRDHS
eukprot:IDg17549t1